MSLRVKKLYVDNPLLESIVGNFSNFLAGQKTSNVKNTFSNKKRKKFYNYLKLCRVTIPIPIASRAGANVMASRYLKTAIKKDEYVFSILLL